MDSHDRPLFNKLYWQLVTLTIFVRCQRLIARKVAELSGFNPGIQIFLHSLFL